MSEQLSGHINSIAINRLCGYWCVQTVAYKRVPVGVIPTGRIVCPQGTFFWGVGESSKQVRGSHYSICNSSSQPTRPSMIRKLLYFEWLPPWEAIWKKARHMYWQTILTNAAQVQCIDGLCSYIVFLVSSPVCVQTKTYVANPLVCVANRLVCFHLSWRVGMRSDLCPALKSDRPRKTQTVL